ncbi:MAG TPA: L,D-transpeptidase [Capillimicrobium sp.]|jgi:lipoprotein-anchoring transpeptidase ErfK/SrfK
MTRRLPARAAAALIALAVLAPASADASSRSEVRQKVIGEGVSVAGVDVGGLKVREAQALLREQITPQAMRSVTVRVAGRTFTLTAQRAKVRHDAFLSARRAYRAARDEGAPTGPRVEGGAVPAIAVDPKITHSRLAVRAWSREVRAAVHRAPRNATLTMKIRRMKINGARKGRTIDAARLRAKARAQLADALGPRPRLRQDIVRTKPAVNNQRLRRSYPRVITVDRHSFRLRLFKRLRLHKTYGIALGAAGYDTPGGRFAIQSKQVNPAWHVPNSAWAGSLQGQVIPGGAPDNPLKARWMGVNGAVGIHGTAEEWSIGSRASHGCIRMRVADVIDLYGRVSIGTPVLIN